MLNTAKIIDLKQDSSIYLDIETPRRYINKKRILLLSYSILFCSKSIEIYSAIGFIQHLSYYRAYNSYYKG